MRLNIEISIRERETVCWWDCWDTNIERWRKIWTVTLFIGFEGKLREAASQWYHSLWHYQILFKWNQLSLLLAEDSPPTWVLDFHWSHFLEILALAILSYSSSATNCPLLWVISVVKTIQDSVKRALELTDTKGNVHYFLIAAATNYPRFSV